MRLLCPVCQGVRDVGRQIWRGRAELPVLCPGCGARLLLKRDHGRVWPVLDPSPPPEPDLALEEIADDGAAALARNAAAVDVGEVGAEAAAAVAEGSTTVADAAAGVVEAPTPEGEAATPGAEAPTPEGHAATAGADAPTPAAEVPAPDAAASIADPATAAADAAAAPHVEDEEASGATATEPGETEGFWPGEAPAASAADPTPPEPMRFWPPTTSPAAPPPPAPAFDGITLEMPGAGPARRPSASYRQILDDMSLMFRIERKNRSRRNLLLTVAVVGALVLAAAALAWQQGYLDMLAQG